MTYEQVSRTICEQADRLAHLGRRIRIILLGPDAFHALDEYWSQSGCMVACHNYAFAKGEGEFCGHKWRLMSEPGVAIFYNQQNI